MLNAPSDDERRARGAVDDAKERPGTNWGRTRYAGPAHRAELVDALDETVDVISSGLKGLEHPFAAQRR